MRRYTQRLRVNFVDTDLSGRIHYTAAMRYFEATEHALMRAIMLDVDGPRPLLPRVHVEAVFAAMLSWDEELACTARVAKVGRTSLTFDFSIVRVSDGVEAVTGKIVAVSVDENSRSVPFSDAFRAAAERDVEAGVP